jgi:hypothetical protein
MTQLSNVEISLNGPSGRSKPASPFHGPEAEVPVETLGFRVLEDCVYQSKHLGSSNQEALGCDCGEVWGRSYPSPSFARLLHLESPN